MRILAVNAGSSSLKLSLLADEEILEAQGFPLPTGSVDTAALQSAITPLLPVDAVAHRVVHGGAEFVEPQLVDATVRRRLDALVDLAPLHMPKSLACLDAVGRLLPDVPAVACFDTAFHAGMPAAASTYALPEEWRRRWPLRRFGFHGLSHAWASARAAQLAGVPVESLRVVTCHLGSGASLAAVHGGVSVDTTMGFSPLEGVVMATRSGTVDPGLVLWLEEHAGLPPAELASTLEHRSGLLGLAGSADMRQILEAEERGDERAVLAIAVYLHRLRAAIAAMAAAMGGMDLLTFSGGVGENSPAIRVRAAEDLGFLGVAVREGPARSARHADDGGSRAGPDFEITGPDASVRAFVIPAREDVQMAREAARVLGRPARR